MCHQATPDIDNIFTTNPDPSSIKGYLGIDLTASSLHIGHLIVLNLIYHFLQAGHTAYIVLGGGTTKIGDPSGRNKERPTLERKKLQENLQSIQIQLRKLLGSKIKIINNNDWLGSLTIFDFFDEVGRHFTLNYLSQKELVKRSKEHISYAEASYALLQGYDFYHLFSKKSVQIQFGGSDQWGNILTGSRLINRKTGKKSHILTVPLLTKEDGSKFSKSEKGTIWLDSKQTSPLDLLQTIINWSDQFFVTALPLLTTYSMEKISDIIKKHQSSPHIRYGQSSLASNIMERLYKKEVVEDSFLLSKWLYQTKTMEEINCWSEEQRKRLFALLPHTLYTPKMICPNIVSFLVKSQIFTSLREGREIMRQGGIEINKKIEKNPEQSLELLWYKQRYILVRKKKKFFLIEKKI